MQGRWKVKLNFRKPCKDEHGVLHFIKESNFTGKFIFWYRYKTELKLFLFIKMFKMSSLVP